MKNSDLHTLYKEKILEWRDLAIRWDRQECDYRELAEAPAAMEVIGALLLGMARRDGLS